MIKKFLIISLFLPLVAFAQYTNEKCFADIGCFPVPNAADNFQTGTQTNIQMYYNEAITSLKSAIKNNLVTLNADGTYSGTVTGTTNWKKLKGWGKIDFFTYTFVNNVLTTMFCGNSHDFVYNGSCTNGANNPPFCDQCSSGATKNANNQCVCNNGSSNPQNCNSCTGNLISQNNLCVCANGATNPGQCNICPSGSNMVNNQCVCGNGGSPLSFCTQCAAGQSMFNGQCVTSCNMTNACGQTIQGAMVNGVCRADSSLDINSSCIVNFNVSSGNVTPNGSVEFSWKIAGLPANVKSNCGFVDLTTPTPRPIPGLQNLDPSVDKTRINNIQNTTRFCLVCQFINKTTNANLGEAVSHQWVRVIRIGEN